MNVYVGRKGGDAVRGGGNDSLLEIKFPSHPRILMLRSEKFTHQQSEGIFPRFESHALVILPIYQWRQPNYSNYVVRVTNSRATSLNYIGAVRLGQRSSFSRSGGNFEIGISGEIAALKIRYASRGCIRRWNAIPDETAVPIRSVGCRNFRTQSRNGIA